MTRIGTSDEFVYDVASRLVQAKSNGQTRNYEYDAYGNRTKCLEGSADCQGHSIDSTTNRLGGTNHDAAGNVTNLDGHQYSYDALNMQLRDVDTASGVVREYVYTAADERIAVYTVGQWWRWTIRDTSGKVLREYMSEGEEGTDEWQWVKDYVWREGVLLATRHVPPGGSTAVTYHYHLDHLGTPRRITDDSDRIVGFHDYFAFGPETATSKHEPSLTLFKYTGHERDLVDTSTARPLDYMHARYYSPGMGRFISVDPVLDLDVAAKRPQQWNRYTYALGNPLTNLDPDGRVVVGFTGFVGHNEDSQIRSIVQRLDNQSGLGAGRVFDSENRDEAIEFIKAELAASPNQPVVIIGHSFGGDSALRAANSLNKDGVKVNILVTIDPVGKTGGPGFLRTEARGKLNVPANVGYALNYFQTSDRLGGNILQGSSKSKVVNVLVQPPVTHPAMDEIVSRALVSFLLRRLTPVPAGACVSGTPACR